MLLGSEEKAAATASKVRTRDAEAGPLLPKPMRDDGYGKEEDKGACRAAIGKFFLSDHNPGFAMDAELAARAALFIVITGLPFMIPAGTLKVLDFVMNKGMYTNGVVIFFVYNLGKTSGQTISNIIAGLRGTLVAVMNTWMMYFLFPGGVTEDTPAYVFWFGVVNGAVFILLLLWLDFAVSTKIFSISNFVFFWMGFLQPGADGFECPFTSGYETIGNAGVNNLVSIAVGGVLCIMATMFPYPLWALDRARDNSKELVHQLPGLWRLFTDYLSEEQHHAYQEDQVYRRLKRLEGMSRTLEGNIQNAWYETIFTPKRRQVRRVLNALNKLILQSYDKIFGMWSCSQNEDWGVTHHRMMTAIRPAVTKTLTEVEILLRVCLRSALDGELSDAEDLAIRKMIESVNKAEAEFTAAFKEARRSIGGSEMNKTSLQDLRTEHIFGLCISGFCRMIVGFAEDLSAQKKDSSHFPKVVERGGLKSLFNPDVIFGKAHLNSTLRSTLSIFTGFVVGFFGFEGLVNPYDAGIACTVSVLLSDFLGSAMVKNLGRVQGVVIGTVAGEIVHAIFGGSEWWSVSALATCLFVYAFTSLFVSYHSAQFSSIGCLLAAFGCKMMLSGPSAAADGKYHLDKVASYDGIIGTVVAICIVMFYDLVLAPGRASDMAHKEFMKAWDTLESAMVKHFDETFLTMKFHKETLHSAIASAETMGEEANQEPRYHRTEWKHEQYKQAIRASYRIRNNLAAMEHFVAEGNRDGGLKTNVLQMALLKPHFKKLPATLRRKMEVVRTLLDLFVHETVKPFPALRHPRVHQQFREEEEQAALEFADEVSKDQMLHGDGSKKLDEDPLSQLCLVLGTIDCIFDGLRKIQHVILRSA